MYVWAIFSHSRDILRDKANLRYQYHKIRDAYVKLFQGLRLQRQLANSCGKSSVEGERHRPKMQGRAEKGSRSGSK